MKKAIDGYPEPSASNHHKTFLNSVGDFGGSSVPGWYETCVLFDKCGITQNHNGLDLKSKNSFMRSYMVVISQAFSREIVKYQDQIQKSEDNLKKEREYARYQAELASQDHQKQIEKQKN